MPRALFDYFLAMRFLACDPDPRLEEMIERVYRRAYRHLEDDGKLCTRLDSAGRAWREVGGGPGRSITMITPPFDILYTLGWESATWGNSMSEGQNKRKAVPTNAALSVMLQLLTMSIAPE